MSPELALDAFIVLALLWLGWRTLFAGDPFTGVVLFIAFGLLMSLAWVRLQAPDIALAEAAIGAGLTGALLIDAVSATRGRRPRDSASRVAVVVSTVLGVVAAALLLVSLVSLAPPGGLAPNVHGRLAETGVGHPVTAVLLNLRAYDTWLELGVLVLAVLGAFAAAGLPPSGRRAAGGGVRGDVTETLVAVVAPALVLVAGLLLWRGTQAPGGAFQAGAVLGSAAVLLFLLSRWSLATVPAHLHRLLLGCGFAALLLAAVLPLLTGAAMLEFRGRAAGWIILVVEVAATVTIGTALGLLFAAARGVRRDASYTGEDT